MSAIYLATHGGLGNQLFQIFYASLLQTRLNIKEIYIWHNTNYAHKMPLSSIFSEYVAKNKIPLALSLRIPKILEKIGFNHGYLRVFNSIYLDGYFQDLTAYSRFATIDIQKSLEFISSKINIGFTKNNLTLYHIRLGDFFHNDLSKCAHIAGRISRIPIGSHLVTNQDKLLEDWLFHNCLQNDFTIIKTSHLKDFELLKIMATYKKIISNNSTLALWAAILGKSEIEVGDEKLRNFYDRLIRKI